MKHTAISLGLNGIVAQLYHSDKDDRTSSPYTHTLTLFQAQIATEGSCAPAQSVEMYGAASIIKLRDALLEAYPIDAESSEIDSWS